MNRFCNIHQIAHVPKKLKFHGPVFFYREVRYGSERIPKKIIKDNFNVLMEKNGVLNVKQLASEGEGSWSNSKGRPLRPPLVQLSIFNFQS